MTHRNLHTLIQLACIASCLLIAVGRGTALDFSAGMFLGALFGGFHAIELYRRSRAQTDKKAQEGRQG